MLYAAQKAEKYTWSEPGRSARLGRGLGATRAGVRVPRTPEAVLPRDLQHHPERAPSGVLLSSATTKAIRLSAWRWPTSELKL